MVAIDGRSSVKGSADAQTPTLREGVRHFLRLLRIVRPYWGRMTTGVLLGTAIGLIGMVSPYLSKLYFDQVYPTRDISLLQVLVLAGLAVAASSSVMGAVRGYYSQAVSARLSSATILMFFNHLQHLPVSFFDSHRVGEISSRFGDVRASLGSLSGMLQTILTGGVYLVLVPPFLIVLNWKLAAVSAIALPITALISTATGGLVRKHLKRSAEAAAELGAVQIEAMNHIRTLKPLAIEHELYTTMRSHVNELLHTQLTAGGLRITVGMINSVTRATGTAIFTWYAWTLILTNEMSLGDFVAFSAYLGYLVGPFAQFANLFSSFQQTAITLGRMFEYLDEQPEQDPTRAYVACSPYPRARGRIAFEKVSLKYSNGFKVLNDISLELRPGTVTAIVGPSGSGKSSILRLLCRMCTPESGNISLDGRNISDLTLTEYRRQISIVWQEFAIFRGTLFENITYGLDPNTPELLHRVNEAVRLCQLDSLVMQLPEGYNTPLSEWGATLSGGQRQRIALARAVVRDTPILLLDEATSQVDALSEEQMLRGILARTRTRTVVFVTHRINTASLADRICVLEGGYVRGLASHNELASSCASYQKLLEAGAGSVKTPTIDGPGRTGASGTA